MLILTEKVKYRDAKESLSFRGMRSNMVNVLVNNQSPNFTSKCLPLPSQLLLENQSIFQNRQSEQIIVSIIGQLIRGHAML